MISSLTWIKLFVWRIDALGHVSYGLTEDAVRIVEKYGLSINSTNALDINGYQALCFNIYSGITDAKILSVRVY